MTVAAVRHHAAKDVLLDGSALVLRRGDIALAVGVMAILVVLILPLPRWLLDICAGVLDHFSVLILMTALFIQQAAGVQLRSRPCC